MNTWKIALAVLAAVFLSSPSFAETVPADRPITLEEAISLALKGHPRIKGAEEDVNAGRYTTMETASTFWPQLSFQADRNFSHSERVVRFADNEISTKTNVWTNNFNFLANWTVFDFGRTYYGVRSSRALERSLREDLGAAEQGVAYDVMDAYFGLLRAQTLVKVAEETLGAAESHLRQAQAFFEVGVKPKFDVTKAEVEVNDAKVQVITAQDAVKAARVNLNTRMNIDPLAPTAVEDRPGLERLEKPLDSYLKEAVDNRPEIKSLRERFRSSELNVRGQFAGYLPTVSASGQYGWLKEDHTDFLNNYNVQLVAGVPIFEGFRTYARVGQARAQALSARYRVEDAKNGVLNETARAFLDVEDAKARTEALEVSVRSARENLEIAQGRYEAGVGAIIDVTDAQVSLTRALTDRAQAFYDYHLAYSRLLRSTGTSVK